MWHAAGGRLYASAVAWQPINKWMHNFRREYAEEHLTIYFTKKGCIFQSCACTGHVHAASCL